MASHKCWIMCSRARWWVVIKKHAVGMNAHAAAAAAVAACAVATSTAVAACAAAAACAVHWCIAWHAYQAPVSPCRLDTMLMQMGTPQYVAPEAWRGQPYSYSAGD